MLGYVRRVFERILRPPKRAEVKDDPRVESFLDKASQYAAYTPDVAQLESQNRHHLLFVYDALKNGMEDGFVLDREGVNRGEAFTCGNYHLFFDRTHANSVALKEQDRPAFGRIREPLLSSRPASIKGVVFLLQDWRTLITLDNMRENGYVFRRERVKVILPYDINHGSYKISERQHMHVWAWWYVGHPDWYNALEGDPENFKTVGKYEPRDPCLRSYYDFTMREINAG